MPDIRRISGASTREATSVRKFSLSSFDGLPQTASGYPIHTDFRVILRIFRMMDDVEIAEQDKPMLLRVMFFLSNYPADAEALFAWFVGMGREAAPTSGVRDFDYEQDAAEIWSAFMKEYGIDLLTIDYLHWWKFMALLEGVFAGDNALANKVRIRHVDDGENEKKAALNRQKMAVALTETVGREEANLTALLTERLEKGLPVGDLLKR